MGYRSTAFLENVNFFHSPTVCLPGSGWKTISQSRYEIPDVPVFGTLPVTQMVMQAMGTRYLVYFWFQTKEKATHDKNINRFHLALHAMKKDNTHDLFIRPITGIGPNETLETARQRMDGFVRDMMAALDVFLAENQFEDTGEVR
jgi:EpsI family protein